MDREGSKLHENHETSKENCSLLTNSQTSLSPSDQPTEDGTGKVISPIPEQRKDATVQSDHSPQPSKETSKKDDRCAQCLLACLFCELLFLCKSILETTSCGRFNTCSCCAEYLENDNLTCCTDCEDLEESCVNSDCIGICSECCGLCFPS
ncbi:myoD family inhibitor domain-containing protein-like [Stegostoma tigrinum]|uniref:myoD family inhibitor domain-containing protein-like n=1 Tax=Stegostoma tigrinum TaxID=3053191 RepID=UPI00202B6490|nr:myoD family inhibitor domain-containing protein-like [Stegostoma tigrinum]XP_048403747.1 myoD family inhibitor domain-containing protein-like [Stegostoma tigrinum]